MIVIACVDEKMGVTFNRRRLSRDRLLIDKVMDISGGKVSINEYSAPLFEGRNGVNVSDSFLDNAALGEYCFVENVPLAEYEVRIEKIILFNWNRRYPSDRTFDISLSRWKLVYRDDFPGNSHQSITMEVFVK